MTEDVFTWKTDRPWPNPRLKRAAIVGHTTPTSARLWFRTGSVGAFTLLVFKAEELTPALSRLLKQVPLRLDELPDVVYAIENDLPDATFKIEHYNDDTTYVVEVSELTPGLSLQPDTEYRFALHGIDGDMPRILIGQDRRYGFRTLIDAVDQPLSFGFYSCHMPYKQSVFGGTQVVNVDMWNHFKTALEQSDHMSLVIGGGDQAYVDGVKSLSIWQYLSKVARKENGELMPTTEAMCSWYRDIYRGYWGFEALKTVYSRYPQYMIWDDHELGDGWGSHKLTDGQDDELNEMFDWESTGLSRDEALTLVDRMKVAATRVYEEYQHSHNPQVDHDQYDYTFTAGAAAYYVTDGRSQRDIRRADYRVMGREQVARFDAWLNGLDVTKTPFVFVVAAVPMIHLCTVLANADDNVAADLANLQDDLRDSWEHELHDVERKHLMDSMFVAANRGFKICILSGDVHTSAAFRLTDQATGKVIYQLTSSAITYNKPRLLSWILGKTVSNEGKSVDGYHFDRLALYTESNFSLIKVVPETGRVWFQLFGKQAVSDPDEIESDKPVCNSIANLELRFD